MLARNLVSVVALVSSVAFAGESLAQSTQQPTDGALTLVGLDGRERRVAVGQLASLPRIDTTVTAHRVTGRYAGAPVSAVLALVGAPTGDSLRGRALATYVVVSAADGYRVAFSLGELDAGLSGRTAILAYSKDGAPLPADEGPFRLIVAGDSRPARWARQVVRLEVRRAP